MAVPRQDGTTESSGRVNQKRRTKKAIVDAARAILDRGETPTVATAAEEALVSRTTAYRYFPTQESLLVDLSVADGVDEIDQLIDKPLDGGDPEARLLEVVDRFNTNALTNEMLYRSAARFYLDMWLAVERAGEDHEHHLREGRRSRWLSTCLEPFSERMSPQDLQRLHSALCLVVGTDAMTVLRDICRLEPDEAVAIAHWAAEAILAAGLPQTHQPTE